MQLDGAHVQALQDLEPERARRAGHDAEAKGRRARSGEMEERLQARNREDQREEPDGAEGDPAAGGIRHPQGGQRTVAPGPVGQDEQEVGDDQRRERGGARGVGWLPEGRRPEEDGQRRDKRAGALQTG